MYKNEYKNTKNPVATAWQYDKNHSGQLSKCISVPWAGNHQQHPSIYHIYIYTYIYNPPRKYTNFISEC